MALGGEAPESCGINARATHLCYAPKVEAECLNRARPVSSGGRPAMGVPTAI